MLNIEQRKAAFVKLGLLIGDLVQNEANRYSNDFDSVVKLSEAENKWFTKDSIIFTLQHWHNNLKEEKIDSWLKNYVIIDKNVPQRIGIIMAGNIPLVGFHDLLCVLITGNVALIKMSSNDKTLLPFILDLLLDIESELKFYIKFIKHKLTDYDAVIATGSNNTSRYFEYYFRNVPHIIRNNRNGISIITGEESEEDMHNLGNDIFQYFGLGCRNVSKLYVCKDFDFEYFYKGISSFKSYIYHHKYANNYDYNKAVYLMSDIQFFDNDFLILTENANISSPIGVLNYEYYTNNNLIQKTLENNKEKIQCIVGHHQLCTMDFGKAQNPQLSDYADGIDVIHFLLNLDTNKHYEKTQF